MDDEPVGIFFSHAGPDKLIWVDFLYTLLKEANLPVKLFLDHDSLTAGGLPKPHMEKAAHEARVGTI
jgi:hypothetical protein